MTGKETWELMQMVQASDPRPIEVDELPSRMVRDLSAREFIASDAETMEYMQRYFTRKLVEAIRTDREKRMIHNAMTK